MSIFEAVKQSVTTRQAAERYGIRVERNGMCRCPFHDDSTPSMKLDRRYYCFGCGATGDVIDFVSRLRGIGSKEAAILLAQDFAIPYEDGTGKMSKPRQQNTDEQNYQHMERYCFRVLLDYYRLLCRWKEDYAPQTQPARDADAGGRPSSALCRSIAEALVDCISAGRAAVRGYTGAGIRCNRIWRGSEET